MKQLEDGTIDLENKSHEENWAEAKALVGNSVTAKEAEAYETPRWAVDAILRAEILTSNVFDPCAGKGVLMDAARDAGYDVSGIDKYDWGYPYIQIKDFLADEPDGIFALDVTVLMNPPFSLAEKFVLRAMELNARKIVCFQRFAWWESAGRREFWDINPPNRVYICGNRATCWRFDVPAEKRIGGTPTAHAWFIWERGHPHGTTLGHVFKERPAEPSCAASKTSEPASQLTLDGVPETAKQPVLYDGRPLDDWFAEFWENYPRFRRTDKAACRNLFERIVNGKQKLGKVKITGTPAEIVDGARRMRAAQGDKYQYSINPARFLRNGGWTNEFEKPDNGRETAEQERDRGRSGIAAAVARRVGPGGSSSGDPGASRGDDRGAGTPLLTSDTDRGR